MESSSLPDEVLFALFNTIPPLETGKYVTVSRKWASIINDNELWRNFSEQRWQVLPKEKDIAKNWMIPTKKQENRAIRIDWLRYYLLRDSNDRQFAVLKQYGNTNPFSRKKKQVVTDYFAKTGFIEAKEVKLLIKTITNLMSAQDVVGQQGAEFPAHLVEVITFLIDLELHMASKMNVSRLKLLGFAGEFLELDADISTLEQPDIELRLSKRLVKACRDYYRIGLQNDLPMEPVGEFYQSVLQTISHFRTFKQRKAQAALLSELLEIIADSLTNWKVDGSWVDWSEITDEDKTAPAPLDTFITCFRTGASLIGTMLTKYAAAHFPPKNDREMLTLVILFGSEMTPLAPIYTKHRTDIINKYFLPPLQSSDPEILVPFMYIIESVATNAEDDFVFEFGKIVIPRLLNEFASFSKGPKMFVITTIASFYRERSVSELASFVPQLLDLLTIEIQNSSYTTAKIKTIADSIVDLLRYAPSNFEPIKDKLVKAFKTLHIRYGDEISAQLVELASAVNEPSLPGVQQVFEHALEDYLENNQDPRVLIRMCTFLSATDPNGYFFHRLTDIYPILSAAIQQDIVGGIENILYQGMDGPDLGDENEDDDNADDQLDVGGEAHDQFFEATDRRTEIKSLALMALGNILNRAPKEVVESKLDAMQNLLLESIAVPGAEEIYTQIKVCLRAMASFLAQKMTNDEFRAFVRKVFQSTPAAQQIVAEPDVLIGYLIELEDVVAEYDAPFLIELLPMALNIIDSLLFVVAQIDENDSVASGNLGTGELTALFELIVQYAPDKLAVLNAAKVFFTQQQHQFAKPRPELWTLYDMISVVYEYCGAVITPENFNFIENLWAARTLDTRYVTQTVAYTLSFLAQKYPHLLPDTKEACVQWIIDLMNRPNIREENAAVYDNGLAALGELINLYVADSEWLAMFRVWIKYCPPTEDGDHDESSRVLALLETHIKRAASIGMDEELRQQIQRVQHQLENFVAVQLV